MGMPAVLVDVLCPSVARGGERVSARELGCELEPRGRGDENGNGTGQTGRSR